MRRFAAEIRAGRAAGLGGNVPDGSGDGMREKTHRRRR